MNKWRIALACIAVALLVMAVQGFIGGSIAGGFRALGVSVTCAVIASWKLLKGMWPERKKEVEHKPNIVTPTQTNSPAGKIKYNLNIVTPAQSKLPAVKTGEAVYTSRHATGLRPPYAQDDHAANVLDDNPVREYGDINRGNNSLFRKNQPAERLYNGDYIFSVAGVSFKNDDETSRQEIIKSLYGKRNRIIKVVPYQYQGERAYAVYLNEQQIGNIKRVDIALYESIIQSGSTFKSVQINKWSKGYYVQMVFGNAS